MPKIPFSLRRSGRYYFPMCVRLLNGKDINVVVFLATCGGQEARERSAILAAHFDKVRRAVKAYFNPRETLDADAIRRVFENELRHCLGKLVSEFHNPACEPAALAHEHHTKASACDLTQRPGQAMSTDLANRVRMAFDRCKQFPEAGVRDGVFNIRDDAYLALIELRNLSS